MSNVHQTEDTVQPDIRVSFQVPVEFKTAIDVFIAHRPGLSLREFCTRLIAKELGIPVPGEEPDAKTKRRAS